MCCSCGCGDYPNDHGDSRHLTATHLRCAAHAAGLGLRTVASNISAAATNLAGLAGKSLPLGGDDLPDVGCRVVKSSEELRYTLGLAYPVDLPDVGIAQDGHQDFVSKDVLREAAWQYLRKGGGVGLHHADGTVGAGVVVESYLWPGEPWQPVPGGYTVVKGDWLLGSVWSPEAWADIKSGKITGFSPQGRAQRRLPDEQTLASLRSRT